MDESGDAGMKLGRGSTPSFTVALVLFQDLSQAATCEQRIADLRRELKLRQSFEFHFTRMSGEQREEFLRAVAEQSFLYFACTIDKAKLKGKAWHKKEYMYQQAAVMALNPALPHMLEAKLVFDATSSKKFNQDLLRFLKKHAGYYEGQPIITATQAVDSRKHNLIQMVDVVCGAVMAEDRRYQRLIRSKEGKVVNYP